MKCIVISQNDATATSLAFEDVADGRVRTNVNNLISRNIK